MTAIRIQDCHMTYRTGFMRRKVHALRGLSLEVAQGASVAFIGPNGAGKTTAIKQIVGINRPDRGTVQLFDRPATDPAARKRLGYLPENPYFYEHLSPIEILAYYGRLSGLDADRIRERTEVLLERVGLARRADSLLREFSKGMRQRLGLAQALLHEPDLLVLDEPFTGLDPIGRGLLRRLIQEERERGRTIFFSSHVLPDAERLCDRVILLDEGRVRLTGSLDELLGGRALAVRLTLEAIPDELETELKEEKEVSRDRHDGGTVLRLPSVEAGERLLRRSVELGATVLEYRVEHPELEDLFFDLAGKEETT